MIFVFITYNFIDKSKGNIGGAKCVVKGNITEMRANELTLSLKIGTHWYECTLHTVGLADEYFGKIIRAMSSLKKNTRIGMITRMLKVM